jgi:hypothetical protein
MTQGPDAIEAEKQRTADEQDLIKTWERMKGAKLTERRSTCRSIRRGPSAICKDHARSVQAVTRACFGSPPRERATPLASRWPSAMPLGCRSRRHRFA